MKETKEREKKGISISIILLVGLLIILACSVTVYFFKNSNIKTYIQKETTEEKFAQYSNGIKKIISEMSDKENVVEKKKVYLFTQDKHSEGKIDGLEVELLKNQEVHIVNIDENDKNTSKLYEKYGKDYKIANKAIDLIEVDLNEYGASYIFIIKEDGTVEYIHGADMVSDNIIVRKLSNLKNITNIILMENGKIKAIDIVGNITEIDLNKKENFENYLGVFGNIGNEWSIKNEDDLRDFWVMSYIKNNKSNLINLPSDSEYDSYIEISQKEIKEFMYKYFGISYEIKNYESEKFYSVKMSGENVILYIKSIGYETYDVEVIDVLENENNITVNLKMSHTNYDQKHTYEAKVSIEHKDDNYFIKNVEFYNSVLK